MEPARPRPSLRRKLLVPLAIIGGVVTAAVLLAVRREMRAQLETQLLAQARLVADAACRIAQTGGTREDFPRFVPLLGSGQGVRSLFIVGGQPPTVIACSWPDWAGRSFTSLPESVIQELQPWLQVPAETSRLDPRRGLFFYATPLGLDAPVALVGARLALQIEAAPLQATILRSAFRVAGIVLLAGALGGTLLALLLRRHVLVPLDALTATGSAPTQYAIPLPAHVAEEFARVGAALAGAFREVRALNSGLESRVATRTAELVSSLERERESMRLKTNFIAIVSHEYRNALNVIQTSARLVEKYDATLEAAERARQLARIREACQRLGELVEDVLFYSRAESAGIEPRLGPVDLGALARELASAHGDSRFAVVFASAENVIVSDAGLLRHALGNLLHNAVKYSPPESQVRLHLAREAGSARIAITDQGPGIPIAELPRLFEPFQRGGNVASFPGTGLGLHIARRCIDALGGTITIENAPGGGTSVLVRLPAP